MRYGVATLPSPPRARMKVAPGLRRKSATLKLGRLAATCLQVPAVKFSTPRLTPPLLVAEPAADRVRLPLAASMPSPSTTLPPLLVLRVSPALSPQVRRSATVRLPPADSWRVPLMPKAPPLSRLSRPPEPRLVSRL